MILNRFNALIDQDLSELALVLECFPGYIPLVCLHFPLANGYNDNHADLSAASRLLELSQGHHHIPGFLPALLAKLPPLDALKLPELKTFLERLAALPGLHQTIRDHYRRELGHWCDREGLHKLQRIALEKKLNEPCENHRL